MPPLTCCELNVKRGFLGVKENSKCRKQLQTSFTNTDCHKWVLFMGFPGGSDGKESARNGDPGLISGSGRSPGEGNGNPLPVFLPGEFHGQRSLLSYSYGTAKSCHWVTLSLFTSLWDSTGQLIITFLGFTGNLTYWIKIAGSWIQECAF